VRRRNIRGAGRPALGVVEREARNRQSQPACAPYFGDQDVCLPGPAVTRPIVTGAFQACRKLRAVNRRPPAADQMAYASGHRRPEKFGPEADVWGRPDP
jgi:hypothetical protein